MEMAVRVRSIYDSCVIVSLDDSASINMDVTVALSHAIFGFMCSFAKNFQATVELIWGGMMNW